MSDRNIDLELIMALAEDSLPPDEAAAAEAALGDASRAELAAQRQALAALSTIEPVSLRPGERARVRAAIRDELNLVPATEVLRLEKAKTPWYVKALPALGAAAAVVRSRRDRTVRQLWRIRRSCSRKSLPTTSRRKAARSNARPNQRPRWQPKHRLRRSRGS